LWVSMGNEYSIHSQTWPIAHTSVLKSANVNIPVQVNGRVRAVLSVPADSSQETVLAKARENDVVSRYLTSEPKKVIYVQGKILNLIV
jgi:leucyl-tRNA synthetase